MGPVRSLLALMVLPVVSAGSLPLLLSSEAAAKEAPRIERVEPFEAAPGARIEVLGSGFSPDAARNSVALSGRAASVLQAAPDRLVVEVPRGTWTGALRVTVGGAESNAQVVRVARSRGNAALAGVPAAGDKAGLPSRAGPLLEKDLAYEQVYRIRHSPDGLTVDVLLDDSLSSVVEYRNEGDAALWTGTYLAAEALRHAATGDPDALAGARRALDALGTLTEITGVRGLWGRNFFRSATQPYAGPGETHDGTGPFAGIRWRGNVSRDQYAGLVFGYAVAWDVSADPAVRAECARRLAEMADHLIANDHRIVDVDGQPTTHGEASQRLFLGIRVTNPVHALIVLAALQAAAVSNAHDPGYARAYAAAARRYESAIPSLLLLDFGARTKWYNFNIAMQPLYTLLRFEGDPSRRVRYEDALRRLWSSTRDHMNGFFTFIHASRAPSRHEGADPLSQHEAIWSLQLFDAPPHRHRRVDGSAHVRQDPIALALFGVDQARDPVPIHLRPRGDFMWQRSPFAYRAAEDLRVEYPGVDYLVAYWMGRHHGYIAADI